jgi:hypothetical protein
LEYFKTRDTEEEKQMKTKPLGILALTLTMILALAVVSWATVPPPPVNQIIGLPDGVFNNLDEAGCRACHENPGIVNPGTIPDRHHLLVGEVIIDPTAAPHGIPGDDYECLSCHELEWVVDHYEFVNFRDCLLCHQQIEGQASVHHITATAQAKDCKACHGPIDNPLDGHYIPDYPTSMVTPYTSREPGEDQQGSCKFCHAAGTDNSTGTEIVVFDNGVNHHSTGLGQEDDNGTPIIPGSTLTCFLCHDMHVPDQERIRRCEDCHGINSLHNIQVDSNGDGVIPAGEDPWYGHIGDNIDCNGCHQTWTSSAELPITPIIPNISGLSQSTVTAGVETSVIVTGSVFINDMYSSIVSLTAPDGTETILTPTEISGTSMVVTIPADLGRGNYALRAVKANQVSNCVNLSVMPAVVITSSTCKDGIVTITGSGFGLYVDALGSETGVTLTAPAGDCTIISWTDTEIVADFGTCISGSAVAVSSVYGAASADVTVKKLLLRRPPRR